MKIEDGKIMISVTDLDHILDVDILDKNRDTPPSELFFKGLIDEMELNGLDAKSLDKVSSISVKLEEWDKQAVKKLL